jgi:dienelactone hydrolase
VPELREKDALRGPVDHDVPVLVVRRRNSETDQQGPLAIVCGYACHATVLSGYQWCGDWPGYAQIAIEQTFPGTQAMVWAGCGADQNPLPRREVSLAEDYGRQLASAIQIALGENTIPIEGQLQTQYAEIPLQLTQIPDREKLLAELQSADRFVAGRAAVLMQQLETEGRVLDSYPYPIQSWQLGDGPAWIFLGGEVVVDYAVRIKELYHPGRTWVTAYANDVMAYIPSQRVLKEGGYEGAGAMLYYGLPGPWADDVEQRIIEEIRRQMNALTRSTASDSPTATLPDYPDHADLTVVAKEDTKFVPIETVADWELRRQHILLGMQRAMGALPSLPTSPPAMTHLQTESLPGCQRVSLRYSTGDGDEVPAHLYLPERERPADGFPVVLALHPTSHLGKRIVGGEGERPNRNYAIELAQRGYLVLAPDYPSFGDYAQYNFHTDQYQSGTMKGIVNHIRGIDVLVNHPAANGEQVAVIGHSLGGHNALFVSAFDQRVKVTITSCGWTPFHDYYGGKVAGWTSARYMPRIRDLYDLNPDRLPFDFYEVCAAIAPRIVYSCSPIGDENFDVAGVRKADEKVRQVYSMFDKSENWIVRYPDAGHDFPDEQRQEAYQLLDRVFDYLPSP